MTKVVGIVGYRDNGKTTLARALARELAARGFQVAVVRHTSHQIDLAGKDTATLLEIVGQMGIVSPGVAGERSTRCRRQGPPALPCARGGGPWFGRTATEGRAQR
jgi:molybdopterin-guanine dinucleotide biosynthesis protein